MKPGIYALASLDGSPLSDRDLEVFGFGSELGELHRTWASRIVNELRDPGAVDQIAGEDQSLLFLGYLNELEFAKQMLGHNTLSSPAEIAARIQDRFPSEAASRLQGDWSFVRWSPPGRRLTLSTSLMIRDQLYWASNGKHIAVAPDMLLLTRLPWVGRSIDAKGMAFYLSNFRIRRFMTRETNWEGVFRVPAGSSIRFTLGSEVEIPATHEASSEEWNGSFDEAVEELSWLGRRIVGQTMERAGKSAFLLSGGIDSSLTTLLGSLERAPSRQMFCLTSVAPKGSELQDEWAISQTVTQTLKLPHFAVEPATNYDPYRPSEKEFLHSGQPTVGLRHYLYDYFGREAIKRDTELILDGAAGELTVSQLAGGADNVGWLRNAVRAFRGWKYERSLSAQGIHGALLARFSAEFIAELPSEWQNLATHPWIVPKKKDPKERKGIEPWLAKSAQGGTARPDGIRFNYPFFDQRLLQFASRLPNEFFVDKSADRKLARALLRGHLPNEIVERRSYVPISPTFKLAIAEQTQTAKSRIPIFRDAGLQKILDLNWLEWALSQLAQGADIYSAQLVQTQVTAMLAEFLLWVRST